MKLDEYKQRRNRIFERLSLASIAILKGASKQYRNRDTEYPFRQSSDFYYLTGFCEPEAVLVLIKDSQGICEDILFCREFTPEEMHWIGPKQSLATIQETFMVKRAMAAKEIDILPKLMQDKSEVFYNFGEDEKFDTQVIAWTRSAYQRRDLQGPSRFSDLANIIHELRLIKSIDEIQIMRTAAKISSAAHQTLMRYCAPNMRESALEGQFINETYQAGCRAMSYETIVAAGKNACTLHYTDNNDICKAGELVLVDAGAEYLYYASDITRTYPVNGKFTQEQRALYELVLSAQLAAIDMIRPEVLFEALQATIIKILVEGLIKLEILKGTVEKIIAEKKYQRFYMHSASHWLGLDVHDVGGYKIDGKSRTLAPGMVLTVEPGLYISENQADVDKRWWGMGIRIEDDVLVTESGHEVLSDAPKTIEDIESIMQASKKTA